MQVAIVSIISNAAKSSLCAYFEGVNWPLNKALPKGAEFLNGPLGDIMRQFCLVKSVIGHGDSTIAKRRDSLNSQSLVYDGDRQAPPESSKSFQRFDRCQI